MSLRFLFCLVWSAIFVSVVLGLPSQPLPGSGTLVPSELSRGEELALNLGNADIEEVRNLNKLLLLFAPTCVGSLENAQSIVSSIESLFGLTGGTVYSNDYLTEFHAYLTVTAATDLHRTTINFAEYCLSRFDYEPLLEIASTGSTQEDPSFGGLDYDVYMWNLDALDASINGLFDYYVPAGAVDVDVYVIDTGVLGAHEEFSELNVVELNKNASVSNPSDDHGTHVAGTIIGKTVGIARGLSTASSGISVYSYDIGEHYAWKTVFQSVENSLIATVKALNATTRRGVINLSIGWVNLENYYGNGSVPWAAEELEAYFEELVDVGGIPITSAGNSQYDACYFHPASLVHSITIGSTELAYNNASGFEFGVSSFSNYGDCVHLYAPGSYVYSAVTTGTTDYDYKSGTSMSSPFVAGLVAQLLSINPSLTFEEIIQILTDPDNTIYVNDCPNANGLCNQITFSSAAAMIEQALLYGSSECQELFGEMCLSCESNGCSECAAGYELRSVGYANTMLCVKSSGTCDDGIARCSFKNCADGFENENCARFTAWGCTECKDGYFKKSHDFPCVSCDTIDGCQTCSNFAGCKTCQYGMFRYWDPDCEIFRCSDTCVIPE